MMGERKVLLKIFDPRLCVIVEDGGVLLYESDGFRVPRSVPVYENKS